MEQAWLSRAEFEAQLAAAGCTSSFRRHERWRNEGLLLPRPRQLPKGRGSTVEHPATSVRQIRAIERALAVDRDIKAAGAVLWIAGFEVDERYWREPMRAADDRMQRLIRIARWYIAREREETLGDKLAEVRPRRNILAKLARRLGDEQFARVLNLGTDVVTGTFEQFEEPSSDRDEFTSKEAAIAAFDFAASERDRIMGQGLNLIPALEKVLSDISSTYSAYGAKDFSDREIQTARDDVLHALKIAFCTYETLSWVYGPEAFGLRLGAWLASKANADAIFNFTLGIARLRRLANDFYSTEQIAALADQSEKNWLISTHFRDLQSNLKLAEIIDPKRWKVAFSDSREYQNLQNELAGYEFPMPDFRPWDQWKQLLGKTTSHGLLAMSIGAPLSLRLEDIMVGANASPAP